ncbi:hypothetical protein [Haloarcula rubripromontorii]|uniref:hypothetical protein n=1 Tax=Haloarcula rubripromontorii TaxID=1705562 RepID=UPI000AFCFAC1|nr:hypothetical protein [Haloarcula rubripromontorii]
MDDSDDAAGWITRVIFWLGIGVFSVTLIAIPALEYNSVINVTNTDFPYNLPKFAQIVNAGGSLLLTLALVTLYRQQTIIQKEQSQIQDTQRSIMETQTGLMQTQYGPEIGDETYRLRSDSENTRQYYVENAGAGAILNLSIEIEVAYTRYFHKKSLVKDRCPAIKVDDGEYQSPGVVMPQSGRRVRFQLILTSEEGDQMSLEEWKDLASQKGEVEVTEKLYFEDVGGNQIFYELPPGRDD